MNVLCLSLFSDKLICVLSSIVIMLLRKKEQVTFLFYNCSLAYLLVSMFVFDLIFLPHGAVSWSVVFEYGISCS